MTKEQVKSKIMSGNLVECTKDEYPDVRRFLQEFAGESIDNRQTIYASISLNEVKRLDHEFGFILS